MEQASTGTAFGHIGVMVTNNDTHSPLQWAEMTTGRIMSLDSEMSPLRARLANELRSCIRDILGERFEKARKDALNIDVIGVEKIADDLGYRIQRASQGTPWQLHFSHPETNKMIWLELLRALNTIISEERAHHLGKGR